MCVCVCACVCADAVAGLCWSPSSLLLASAGGEDRHVRLWHNSPGLKQQASELREKIPRASSDALKVSHSAVPACV